MSANRRVRILAIVVVALLGLAVLGLGGFIVMQLRPAPTPAQPLAAAPQASPTLAPSAPALTAAPAASATPAPRPSQPAAPAPALPALPALDDDQLAQVERVRQDVLDLRGLPPQADIGLYLVDRDLLAAYARARYLDPAALDRLERESRALQTLGLLSPDYDLATTALNRRIVPAGSLYDPAGGVILVRGLRFGAIERWLLAAQLDRALVTERYGLAALLDERACQADPEPCRALSALLAGDTALAAGQWAADYASNADRRDVSLYRAPARALPETLAPPYLSEDAAFLTQKGLRFATYLYAQGEWLGLDRVYRDPPRTSEQILHPRKYSEGELAVTVDPPAGLPGPGWQMDWSSVLGEWNTQLLLSVPVDPAAQLERDLAAAAAAGWGGDHYQVYYHPERNQTALAAYWTWDSPGEAQEFAAALEEQANARYPGGRLDPAPLAGADCWQGPEQISCVLPQPPAVLWLLAPDLPTLRALRELYP